MSAAVLTCPSCGLAMTAARKEQGICFVCEELGIAKPKRPTRRRPPQPRLMTISEIKGVMNLIAEREGMPKQFDGAGNRLVKSWK